VTYLLAFLVGGGLCLLAQLAVEFLPVTPAHVLVGAVVLGGVLGAVGLYEPLVKMAGAGASVPLPGFGYALVRGVFQEVERAGALGVFTGAFKATAAGIKAAIVFAFLAALVASPRD
jgi:stage V sporulation protein AE